MAEDTRCGALCVPVADDTGGVSGMSAKLSSMTAVLVCHSKN